VQDGGICKKQQQIVSKSDYILTHSFEGIDFIRKQCSGTGAKLFYLPHPIKNNLLEFNVKPDCDILIWGTIAPYKGIDKFLEFLSENNLSNKYQINIVGKILDNEYAEIIYKYENENISIRNQFINNYELMEMVRRSRLVLFPYKNSSVLSSGALMDTIGFGSVVVGPDTGAFSDLSSLGFVNAYKRFDELPLLLDRLLENNYRVENKKLLTFFKENSWSGFSRKFGAWILNNKV